MQPTAALRESKIKVTNQEQILPDSAPPTIQPGPEAHRPTYDEMALLAYSFWEGRGCPSGSADADWFRAEGEIQNRQEQVKN